MDEITRALARMIVATRPADIPPTALHAARRSIVNWFGCVLGGCKDASAQALLAALGPFSGPAQASVLGTGQRVDPMLAALANALSGNILDFDDTHADMVLHPAGPVAAALVAIAESRKLHGRDLLHAFVLGVEVEARILDPRVADYKFAWSPTTTVGAFGAAAAVGTVLGLNEAQMSWALGIAASQACGLRETGGSMAKAYNAGHASRCGLVAAMLAAHDFTGPERALEGPNGFLVAFGSPLDPGTIVRDWSRDWHVNRNTFKAFPCGIVTHPAVDAALQLKRTHRFDAEAIDAVVLKVHPVALRLTGRRSPSSPLEAKLSVFHCVAAALVYGRLGVPEFSLACIQDPRVLCLRDGMRGEPVDAMPIDAACVEVRLRDGTALRLDLDHAIGSASRPMSDADLSEKVSSLAQGVLPQQRCEALLERLWAMETLEDSGDLAKLAIP